MSKPHPFQHAKLIFKRIAFSPKFRFYSNVRNPYNPLRILFCGADEFSIFSLKAIRELQHRRPECVASIDVVCRPDKRVGRGLKRVQQVPIKSVARELDLPIHQIDTFTGWSPPFPIDLVIAVSFGFLVPSRILKGATWGGLNVHPSMLPDLRGPAPIQHALLKGRTHTGVTLQTMHPTRFDHGVILAQTPGPGVRIPEECTPDDLIWSLGKAGAEILVRGVVDGLFVDPVPAVDGKDVEGRAEHAAKILPEDRHIDWKTWTAERIIRYDRVLGRLWDMTTWQQCHAGSTVSKRVTFNGPWRSIPRDQVSASIEAGKPAVLHGKSSQCPVLLLPTVDGHLLTPASATIEGEQKEKGLATLIRAKTSTS